MQKDYELIEHTADIGVRVRAGNLKGLFRNAALAMFDIIAEKKSLPKSSNRQIAIVVKQRADDLDQLFINWLNELLSLSAAKELIFSDFKIKKLEDNNLEAALIGRSAKNYKVNVEIKAATYHELKLKKINSGWQAEVIFDV